MINDVDMRTCVFIPDQNSMDSGDHSHSNSSSQSSSYESSDELTLADCAGMQPYLFEPYDSEASSGTDSDEFDEEKTYERLQNTDW